MPLQLAHFDHIECNRILLIDVTCVVSVPCQLMWKTAANSEVDELIAVVCWLLLTCNTGAGEVSLWEFSGYQPYYVAYDQFVGDVNCIHVVVVNASEPRDVQLSQLLHWLRFITAHIRVSQPIGKSNSLFHLTAFFRLILVPSVL